MTNERKIILAVGGLLLLLAVIYRFGPAVGGLLPSSGDISHTAERVAKYRLQVADRDRLEKRQVALTRLLKRAEGVLLPGRTPALAAVDIQNLVGEMARRSKVEIRSSRMLTAEKPAKGSFFQPVAVQFTMGCTVRQLSEILYRIEAGPKLLVIRQIIIRGASAKSFDLVQTTFTVGGFMKKVEHG